MIGRLTAPVLDWYAGHRRRQLERLWRDPAGAQEATLRRLLAAARDTEFGLVHGFKGIRSVTEYQARVPLREYRDFKPLWDRAMRGEPNVTWRGHCRSWVRTSGTTSGDKLIPVTRKTFAAHRKGGWDAFLRAVSLVGARHLVNGPMLFLCGTTAHPEGGESRVGDPSDLVVQRLPPGFRGLCSPGSPLAVIPDWEERIEAVAAQVADQDLRLLSGVPPWLVILFERVERRCRIGRRPLRALGQLWPNLRVLIHGGVGFGPYASVVEEWMGRRLHRVEVYPAAEGFVAVQTEASGGLTLMLDYGTFYEFVPFDDLASPAPRRYTVADIELNRTYAVVMSTPGGLWSYLLGDTVRFTAREPLRLQITGQIRHYLNAFGEHVVVEEVERALVRACRRTEAEGVEFTVAPRYPTAREPCGGHEWLVEFRVAPLEPQDFIRVVDETLATLNTDYRTKRSGSMGMVPPLLTSVPPGTFYRWMRAAGKFGDPRKVPRVTNDRTLAESLLATAGGAAHLLSTPQRNSRESLPSQT